MMSGGDNFCKIDFFPTDAGSGISASLACSDLEGNPSPQTLPDEAAQEATQVLGKLLNGGVDSEQTFDPTTTQAQLWWTPKTIGMREECLYPPIPGSGFCPGYRNMLSAITEQQFCIREAEDICERGSQELRSAIGQAVSEQRAEAALHRFTNATAAEEKVDALFDMGVNINNDERIPSRLIEVIQNETSREVQQAAIRAFAYYEGLHPQAEEALLKVAFTDPDLWIRQSAFEGLMYVGGKKTLQILQQNRPVPALPQDKWRASEIAILYWETERKALFTINEIERRTAMALAEK